MMSTTTEKAEYLNQTKNAIAEALIEQGQHVDAKDSYRSYAGKVLGIHGRLYTELAGRAIESEHAADADIAKTISEVLPPEKGGTGHTSLNDLIPELGIDKKTEIGHKHIANDVTDLEQFFYSQPVAKIASGALIGDGSNKVTINFGFTPRILMFTYRYRFSSGSLVSGTYPATYLRTNFAFIYNLDSSHSDYRGGVDVYITDNDRAQISTTSRYHFGINSATFTDAGCEITMDVNNGTIYPYDPSPWDDGYYRYGEAIGSDLGTRYTYTAIG